MSWYILPVAARVKCPNWPAIWLPLILLWPLIIAAFCLAFALCLFVPSPRRPAALTLCAAYRVLCALHGTSVEFGDGPRSQWNFALY